MSGYDVMDEYRRKIDKGIPVYHTDFEQQLYDIVPSVKRVYHFCEAIAKTFYDEKKWEEVFISLYGDMPKYSHLKEK